MRLSSRPSPLPPGARALALRRLLAVPAALAVSALAALAFAAAPAGAIVTTVGSTKVGLQPRSTSLFDGIGPEPESFANPGGDPILPSTKTYAIYWDPTDHYHGDWQNLIDTFFQGMGAGSGSLASVFAVDAQYTDAANQHALYRSTFMGAFTDTEPYPSSGNCTDPHPLVEGQIACLTNLQIRGQLESFISLHGLTKGMGTVFYMLTPPGVTVCLDAGTATGHCSDYSGTTTEASYKNSFCSYHADVSLTSPVQGDGNTILYAVIPWTAGGLGDGDLSSLDQTSGYRCQDGGYNPSSKPPEELEHPKVDPEEELAKRLSAEKKENEELTTYEEQHTKGLITENELESKRVELEAKRAQREQEETVERKKREKLEGPHQQEPNQDGVGPDGFPDTGLADLIISQIGVEQQNTVTDPLLNAWQDKTGNEATDECRDFFAPSLGGGVTANEETGAGTLFNQSLAGNDFYLNDAFNLAALNLPYPAVPCLSGVNLEPQFTAPNPINAGELAGFDGMESDISLNWGTSYSAGKPKPTYAYYTWSFGDGTPTVSGFAPGATPNSPGEVNCAAPWESPCAASEFHAYQYGGTYDVTLTVTDTGDDTASVTEPITVDGPLPPSPPAPPSGGSGQSATSNSTSSSGSSSTGATTKLAPAGPVATQAVLSSSLAKATRSGLVVRYSVSQQVAGHFEVLLAASIAHRLGLHPPLATGLPKGTAPQVVIAKAILVTTKGGRSTIKIQFGRVTAARLRRLHRVPLMLRLILRNGAGGTTTVLSKLTLH